MHFKKKIKLLSIFITSTGLVLSTGFIPAFGNSQKSFQSVNSTQSLNTTLQAQDNVQYVNTLQDIKIYNSGLSNSNFAIIKDAVNGDRLYAWGQNIRGQLGLGHMQNVEFPTLVVNTKWAGKTITDVVSSSNVSAVVLNHTELWVSGHGLVGTLGLGSTSTHSSFIRNDVISNKKATINEVALGLYTTGVILNDNELWMWGENTNSLIGNGEWGSLTPVLSPIKIDIPATKLTKLRIGAYSSYVVVDGYLYGWGKSTFLGIGADSLNFLPDGKRVNTTKPYRIQTIKDKIIDIVVGEGHTIVCDESLSLWTWGSNVSGQLGIKKYSEVEILPKFIKKVVNKNVKLYAGRTYSGIIDTFSHMQAGTNFLQPLPPTAPLIHDPTIFSSIKRYGFSDDFRIMPAASHTLFISDNQLWAYGSGAEGRFGNGDSQTYWKETKIDTFINPIKVNDNNKHVTARTAIDRFYKNKVLNASVLQEYVQLNFLSPSSTMILAPGTTPYIENDSIVLSLLVDGATHNTDGAKLLTPEKVNFKNIRITGFKGGPTLITNITAKDTYPQNVVVDKWLTSVTEGSTISKTEISKYLNLENVPLNADLHIAINGSPDYKNGILNFYIASSSYLYDDDTYIDLDKHDPFKISLKLTPRITKFSQVTDYPNNLTSTELQTKLFDSYGNVIDNDELFKYLNVVAPVDKALYQLVPNSLNASNDGSGKLSFTIKTEDFYNNEGIKNQDAELTYNLNLQLKKDKSIIEPKKQQIKTTTVDKFVEYIFADGNLVNTSSKFAEFFDFNHVPNDATFEIKNFKPGDTTSNFATSFVSFSLVVSAYNDGVSNVPIEYERQVTLHLDDPNATIMKSITSGYPNQITPSVLRTNLFGDNDQIKDVYEFTKYVDITNSVDDAVYHLVEGSWSSDNTKGLVSFSVQTSDFYDEFGVLNTDVEKKIEVQIDLQLIPEKSNITVKEEQITTTTPSGFMDYIYQDGLVVVDSKLNDFFTFENMPHDATFIIENPIYITQNSDLEENEIQFDLIIKGMNDGLTMNPIEFKQTFKLSLASVEQKPVIITLKNTYSTNLTMSEFVDQLSSTDGPELISFLSSFLDFDSMPEDAVVKVVIAIQNEIDNKVGIKVIVKYDIDSLYVLSKEYTSEEIVLTFNNNAHLVNQASFDWWWILVAVGGAALLGVAIWLISKKMRSTRLF